MMRGLVMSLVTVATLAGCGEVDPIKAAQRCEARARAAQGPTGGVTLGVNNRTGGFANARVGISSDFVRGLDADAVYDECYFNLTGEAPTRRPVLHN